jgi:hypothetical protein
MVKRAVQARASQKERAARGIHTFSDSQAVLKALINPRMVLMATRKPMSWPKQQQ